MEKNRRIIVFIATSADGYIARPDGDVGWLDRPRPKGNYGMGEFLKTIDTILWGRKTYGMGIEKGMNAAGFGKEIKLHVFSSAARVVGARSRVRQRTDQDFHATIALATRQGYLDDGRRQDHRFVSRCERKDSADRGS